MDAGQLMLARLTNRRGVTLIELLLASTISLFIILGMTAVDIATIRLRDQIRDNSAEPTQVGLAYTRMVNVLQESDRVVLSAGRVRARVPLCGNAGYPLAGCYDDATNYQWHDFEYDADNNTIDYNRRTGLGGCVPVETFEGIFGMQLEFRDNVPTAPPGGEPFASGRDNNAVRIVLTPPAGVGGDMHGEAILRPGVYSNLNANCGGTCDSGDGLSTVSPLPAGC